MSITRLKPFSFIELIHLEIVWVGQDLRLLENLSIFFGPHNLGFPRQWYNNNVLNVYLLDS